ncbi:MAG: uroporphyrinogen decarboxylase family protein [Candidatus Zipacnadales bacterium]
MTSRERVVAALERREPDRVPLFEPIIDPKVIQGILPGGTYEELNDLLQDDCIGLNRSSWDKSKMDFIDEEKGLFRDRWGVIRALGQEAAPYPVEPALKCYEDLKTWSPPDPADPTVYGHLPELVAKYKGQKAIVFMGRDGYFNPAHVRGVENFLMDMILNPKFVHELIDICLEYDMEVVRRAVKLGVDVIVLGDDYADKNTSFMSPQHFREFILPALKKAIRNAHEAGAYVIKHTDGNIWSIIDQIVEAGPDGLNPLEPVAGMDLGKVKQIYGDKVALIGNIDCGRLLSWGTPQEVKQAVKQAIAVAGPGGGYMVSSSNSIHSSVKPENLLAMAEAVREYGHYPLQIAP